MLDNKFKELFNDTKQIKFGCVMFDLQEGVDNKLTPMPGSGWASIEGGNAYRINNVGDLSNEIQWITNLSQEIFWKTGVARQNKLKYSGYLRTDISQIIKELGLTQPRIPIVEICKTISEIYNKVMRLAIEFYEITGFTQKDLATEIRNKLYPNDLNISTHVDEALSRAYQDLVVCEHPISKEKVNFITLKRPRYYHAKSILESSIPLWNGDWTFIGQEEMPVNITDKIEFLMKKEKPFVVKVAIHSFGFPNGNKMNIDLNRLLNLGEAIGEGGKPKPRNWVCQAELLYLSRFADLDIEAAFIAEGYQELNSKTNLPYLGELSDFSYSLGLLSECVWIGLASRSVNPQTKSKSLVSPRACWLKAADRFMTLTSAMMLSSAGFVINSYGYGGVSIMVEDSKLSKLIEIAPHAGLTVPMNIIEKHGFSA